MDGNFIKIEIAAIPENISVIRLVASAMASRIGFDIEDIDDIKVCVSEACTNAIRHGKKDMFLVEISTEESEIDIKVCDKGKGCVVDEIPQPNMEDPKEGGLGIFIIKSLMDDVELVSNGNGTNIFMKKFRKR